ncbi:SDR family NAD(P)-dependent oxidoreductase [Bacillus cihuensis]|uniref:SDR family NAD(P)-dependent oxidoreductase n=1 Tax=Bacillus cihuensis TaxID=1208599 RepID=UPI0004906AF3
MSMKALVLGATGGMGNAIVYELLVRGVEVTAFARNIEKLNKLFKDQKVRLVQGDVFNKEQVNRAVKNADVVFHSINIPYEQWEGQQPILMGNILDAVQKSGAKLAIVDNIYAYGRNPGTLVTETTRMSPHTKKGKIRLELNSMVKESGVPMLIAHFPDFYGPHAENTLLDYTFQAIANGKKARFVGNQMLPREFIYTPDGAKAICELAMQDRFEGGHWNIPGTSTITGKEIIELVRELTGYEKKVSTVSKNMIRLLGVFDPGMREMVEMFYLNEDPVVLDGGKYEREIGLIPMTPYKEGFQKTLESIAQ